MYFFPHIYLRSKYVKEFSRGNIPYSLHTKSILIKKKGGKMDICISSSNFAVRDLVKEENLLIIKDEPKYAAPVAGFFDKLIARSIRIDRFDFNGNYSNYKVGFEKKALCRSGDFMAPFYYNSPFLVEDYITERLKSAQRRIIIVGQHICPVDHIIRKYYHSDFKGKPDFIRKGFVNVLVEKAQAGVPVEILSQTFASGDDQFDEKFRSPANKKAFFKFYAAIRNIAGIQYAVNENVHSKYIVIDDQVFVTTFNYTPTEFIYLDQVRIDHFQNNKGRSYSGIFSEVGHFVVSDFKPLVEEYVENFKLVKSQKNTIQVKGPHLVR
jgi:phosphatidylserine/phosphatidylglycerophosphate/cardiolipin synthase-like enzyme